MKNILIKLHSSILLLFAFTLSFHASGQTLIEDAIFLRQFIKESESGALTAGYFVEMEFEQYEYFYRLKRILDIPDSVGRADIAQAVSDSLFNNPYISADEEDEPRILMPQSYATISIREAKDVSNSPVKNYTDYDQDGVYSPQGYSRGGNLSTRLVDGFSRWLVNRTKQELSLHFFSKFNEAVNRQPDLRCLFPTTHSLLNVLGDEIYHYEAFLTSLREGFISDYELIPNHLPNWAAETNLIENDNARFLLKEGLKIPPMVLEEVKPYEMIDHLGSVDDCPKEFETIFNSFKLLKIISNSVYGVSGWTLPEEFDKNVDELTLYLYLGLLFEKGENLDFGTTTFGNYLTEISQATNKDKNRAFKEMILNLLEQGKKTDDFLYRLENTSDSVSYPQFYDYTTSTLGLFKTIQGFTGQFTTEVQNENFSKFINTIDNGNKLIYHVQSRNYLQGLADMNNIIDNFIGKSTNPTLIKSKDEFLKYATFMATVADAQTSTEIEYAFEIFALPPGSSRMKKYSKISVALNAYVGPTVGTEFLEQNNDKTIFALHAPVGVNINRGANKRGSHSLFFPILDVGAVTAFRFGDNTSTLPELSFKNLIAPGMYYVYGFGNDKPFALGVGGQLGPNTRKIEKDAAGNVLENVTDSGVRLGVFLSVDIPVFHFYTR